MLSSPRRRNISCLGTSLLSNESQLCRREGEREREREWLDRKSKTVIVARQFGSSRFRFVRDGSDDSRNAANSSGNKRARIKDPSCRFPARYYERTRPIQSRASLSASKSFEHNANRTRSQDRDTIPGGRTRDCRSNKYRSYRCQKEILFSYSVCTLRRLFGTNSCPLARGDNAVA